MPIMDGRLQMVAGVVKLLRGVLPLATPSVPASAIIADWPLPGLGPTVGADLTANPPQVPILVVVSVPGDSTLTRGQQGLAAASPFLPAGSTTGAALSVTGRQDTALSIIVAAAGTENRVTAATVAATIDGILGRSATVPMPDALDSDLYTYGLTASLVWVKDREVSHEAARGMWRRELDYTASYNTYLSRAGTAVSQVVVRRDNVADGSQSVIVTVPAS